ncbi:T9SS type A sorting domain-containing protein [Chryseobacterium arthrosphaerae]|uniref:T9SS type A sorting domain-containing protein n=1 Tax=Chryseobacterium arthrosphaerae TaxID=651561 RepID=UPI0023E1D559|nr:T9SS type A sorting domain-containing protein [Chryseobacterium arthrosphaerae]WES98176.1 T9SS type A sorting domain-containing protein [Chryseobacterium arthrosphaerae]
MKKIYLVLLLISWTCLLRAQTQPVDVQDNTLETAFSELEKDRIPTGFLLDAAIEFANFQKYDGSIPDSSYTSSKLVAGVYNTLLMSRLSASAYTPKSPAEFVSDWKNAQAVNIIPLGGLFYEYSQFSAEAVNNAQTFGDPGIVSIYNGKFRDKYRNGIWRNPYEQKSVFAIAPSINSHDKLAFKIKMPSNLFISNQSSLIQSIEYRLSDNAPYQLLVQDQLIDVSYSSMGTYTWTFKMTLTNGQILYSHTKFVVDGDLGSYVDTSASTSKNANLEPQSKRTLYSGNNRATMYIHLAPGRTRVTKPLIVAEGFDMGNFIAPTREAGLTNIQSFKSSLLQGGYLYSLINSDYDIIYVDWNNGVDYIQNNSGLLAAAISWVNANKVGAEQNVVIGQSMGGLVARYALKDMEDHGIAHQTKLYVSHDSPHLGANIPLSIQNMLVNVTRSYVKTPIAVGVGEFVVPLFNDGISIGDMLTLTDTPAARQMLINYVNRYYQIDNSVHDNWQNILKAKGYPQQSRNVAISNGSECGTDQTLSNLVRLYKETSNQHMFSDILGSLIGVATNRLDMIVLASLPGSSKYVFDFTAKPMTQLNASNQIYNGSIKYKKKILWLVNAQVSLLNGTASQPSGILPYDKYGGGRFMLAMNEIPSSISNDLTVNEFSFIPTPSALDYKTGNTVLTETDFQKPFSANEPNDVSQIPFVNFMAETVDQNNGHIRFSNRSGLFLQDQLSSFAGDHSTIRASAYLCGDKVKIGGEDVLCGTGTPVAYTTGFAPSISWSIIEGASLVDINGPTDLPQFLMTPKPNANGLVTLQAFLQGDGGSNTVTKNVWIGGPRVKMPNASCGNPYDTVCFNSGSYGQLFNAVIDGVGMESNYNNDTDYEWEKVYGNFTFVSSGNGYLSTVSNNGTKVTGRMAILSPTTGASSMQVRARAKNRCGWGPWKNILFNNYGSRIAVADEKFFTISPNPTVDFINISLADRTEVPQNKSEIKAELYNNLGVVQKAIKLNNNKGTINATGLLQGVYTLKLTYDDKVENHQVIIR